MISDCEETLLHSRKWLFLGVTASGHFVYRDEAREYLYIPADKKNKMVRIKQGFLNGCYTEQVD